MDPDDPLLAIAETARLAAAADLAVVRLPEQNRLVARAVAGSAALAAEVEGSRIRAALPEDEVDHLEDLPLALRGIVERAGAKAALLVPVRVEGRVAAVLELFRGHGLFGAGERDAARVAAAQIALVLRAADGPAAALPRSALMLTAEALAAGGDEQRGADRIARLAADATGATAAVIWRSSTDGLQTIATAGAADAEAVQPFADAVLLARAPAVDWLDGTSVAGLPLGQPPIGVLQLAFPAGIGRASCRERV